MGKRSSMFIRRLPLLAVTWALGLPAMSMTNKAVEPPAPTDSQWALIEAHDTAGIGWWSSALEINPPPLDDRGR